MAADDPMGERVTVAILGERLSTAIRMIDDQNKALKELAAEVRDWNKCQGDLTQRVMAIETLQGTHAEEIKTLRSKDQAGTWANTALAIIAALVGVFVPKP